MRPPRGGLLILTENENYVARWDEQEIMSEKEETGSWCHRKLPGERQEMNQKGYNFALLFCFPR